MNRHSFSLCTPLGDTPFPSVGAQKKDTLGTPQKDTPSVPVAGEKKDTPKGTVTNRYKTPLTKR